MSDTVDALLRLHARLASIGPLAVAVSGGVDSLTLGVAAGRARRDALFVHATSPAVPAEATERVRDWAGREHWDLRIVDAGEFADPNYRANPVDRCFHCKTNLYGAIRGLTARQIVSGANVDDLSEYRPGLDAAREHGVRHPYVEAGIDKATVRSLSAHLGMGRVAELPSSPCLSSRVETGIPIEAAALQAVHAIERFVADALSPSTVRCRVRAAGLVIELDRPTLARLTDAGTAALEAQVRGLWTGAGDPVVRFAPYRTGSAFLIARAGP